MNARVVPPRRLHELLLGLLGLVVIAGGYVLLAFANKPDLPPDMWGFLAALVGLFVVAHLAVRAWAPRADPTLLPIAAALTGLGFVVISRLDHDLARTQALWAAIAVGAFVATLALVRHVGTLARYRYTFLLVALGALVLPLAPGIGRDINGARLWVHVGGLNFQPLEIAKVFLVIFFAAYLADKRELLARGTRRVGRFAVPDPKHLGPLLLAWGVPIAIMLAQRDLGSSLLFFVVFATMLYIATERFAYLIGAAAAFIVVVALASQLFGHVHDRITSWIDPWTVANTKGFQILQALFAFATGGFSGTGLGLGSPQKIPNATTDFIFAAIGEELGILGTVAVLVAFLLLIGSGYRIAVHAEQSFAKLLAAGLSTIVGIQTFIIVGGVTRTIPLTGITLPFISYGGSSLIANFVIVALLLRISHDNNTRAQRTPAHATTAITPPGQPGPPPPARV